MGNLGQYAYSIACAAILCALNSRLIGTKGTISAIGKMLGGVFLVFTIIAPLANISLGQLNDISDTFRADADYAVAQGKAKAKKELETIITNRVQAYILDKAKDYDATLTVKVSLSDDDVPIPEQVKISGNISPYGKRQLQEIIATDLGIPKEDQIWT